MYAQNYSYQQSTSRASFPLFGGMHEEKTLEENISIEGYRYGFQGQEMDDEVKGEGNSVNYKYRMHDPRVGRFFAVDHLTMKYPHYSPYAFSGNRVIDAYEFEGLEPVLDKDGRVNPGFTVAHLINLPQGGTATVYKSTENVYVVTRADKLALAQSNVFAVELINSGASSRYHTDDNGVSITTDLDGVGQPNGIDNFRSIEITGPNSIVQTTSTQVNQQFRGVAFGNAAARVGSTVTTITNPLLTTAGNIAGNAANTQVNNAVNNAAPGSTITDVTVTVTYNSRLNVNQVAAFQAGVNATVNNNAGGATVNVNFVAVTPSIAGIVTNGNRAGLNDPSVQQNSVSVTQTTTTTVPSVVSPSPPATGP